MKIFGVTRWWMFVLAAAACAQTVGKDPGVVQAVQLARTWLEAQRAYEQIPGVSAAIVHGQEVLWLGGFGAADLSSGRLADAQTLYSICSISKLFTSIGVMQQRDSGKLQLDDPVRRHLPWFALKRAEGEGEITVAGLLAHASGLPRESDYPYWTAPDFAFPTRKQVMERVSAQEPLYAPWKAFQYSNLGLTLAGEVLAAASGTSCEEYARTRILEPLGMRSTSPDMPEAERGARLATGYSARDRQGARKPLPFFKANAVAPAAGYASTAEDLARFASWQFRLLARGGSEVLRATSLREMYRVHWAEPDFETLRGLGFQIWRKDSKRFVGHGGGCPGYRSHFLLMPEENIATVFLSNAQGVEAERWAQVLYDVVAPAVKTAVKEPGKAKAPGASLAAYVGTYDAQPWGGERAVVPWEDGLALLPLPTFDPLKAMEKWKKTGEHRFRRLRTDDSLGEEIVFEMGTVGTAVRFRQHSNTHPRLR
jgi:CubicO group peptidase (beta-lactamase class C family)